MAKKPKSVLKRIIAKGISAICRSCAHKQQVSLNRWNRASQPRCQACGGALDRIHPRGSHHGANTG